MAPGRAYTFRPSPSANPVGGTEGISSVRLHTRLALTMLTAGAIGAGLLAPGASAAPAALPAAPAAPAAPATAPTAAQIAAAKAAAAKAAAAKAAAAKAAAIKAARIRAAKKVALHKAALRRAAAKATYMRTSAVRIALAKVRQHPQYVAGGRGPHTFDCAGFTWWVWHKAGRHIPDNTWGQRAALKRVSKASARPGDIVLYMNGAHHSELYIGHGKTVGCSNPRTDCQVKSLSGWYADHFTGFYRVV